MPRSFQQDALSRLPESPSATRPVVAISAPLPPLSPPCFSTPVALGSSPWHTGMASLVLCSASRGPRTPMACGDDSPWRVGMAELVLRSAMRDFHVAATLGGSSGSWRRRPLTAPMAHGGGHAWRLQWRAAATPSISHGSRGDDWPWRWELFFNVYRDPITFKKCLQGLFCKEEVFVNL